METVETTLDLPLHIAMYTYLRHAVLAETSENWHLFSPVGLYTSKVFIKLSLCP